MPRPKLNGIYTLQPSRRPDGEIVRYKVKRIVRDSNRQALACFLEVLDGEEKGNDRFVTVKAFDSQYASVDTPPRFRRGKTKNEVATKAPKHILDATPIIKEFGKISAENAMILDELKTMKTTVGRTSTVIFKMGRVLRLLEGIVVHLGGEDLLLKLDKSPFQAWTVKGHLEEAKKIKNPGHELGGIGGGVNEKS